METKDGEDAIFDAAIIGGGAAGLFCASFAASTGARVVVLERAAEVGKKILISGGGRCNFTNIGAGAGNYLSNNPHFAKSALARYTQYDFLALVEKYGIAWHEKTLGQLFCDRSSRQIVAMLLEECARAGVVIRTGADVADVRRGSEFSVELRHGDRVRAKNVVVASGGPSIPKMGATDFAWVVARRLGLAVVDARPGLVPLTFSAGKHPFDGLAGVSCEVEAAAGEASFKESALITHRGLSGPAILQISSYLESDMEFSLDILPGVKELWKSRRRDRVLPKAVLASYLPSRLAESIAEAVLPAKPLAECSDAELRSAEETLHALVLRADGTEGLAKAEVTLGGIDTRELSQKTMECTSVPGLFFVGEGVDVTGWLGGYNFQWAWASAAAAGREIASRFNK